MSYAHKISIALFALMAGALLFACSSSSNEKALKEHRDRAQKLVEKQQFHEALTEYQQVVRLDPNDDEA